MVKKKKPESANSKRPEDIEYAKRVDAYIPEAQKAADLRAAVWLRSLLTPLTEAPLSTMTHRDLLGLLRLEFPNIRLSSRREYGSVWDGCFHSTINEITRKAEIRSI